MLNGYKNKRFALIGSDTDFAFAHRLHGLLADYSFSGVEMEGRGLEEVLSCSAYDGFYVDAPYNEQVIKHLDHVTDTVKHTNSADVVIKKDGKLWGYNTDYSAFIDTAVKNRIDVKYKKAVILGTGGTANSVRAALEDMGADEVEVISICDKDHLQYIELHDNAQILVNTTSCGKFPDVTETPVSLRYFGQLETVIDFVHNPCRTELMLEAEEQGIATVSGLDILEFAVRSVAELFIGRRIGAANTTRAVVSLGMEMKNIVLVGMPGCGKSTVAAELAKFLGREAIDTDRAVECMVGVSIPEIYELYGEDYFRSKEAAVIKGAAFGKGAVIATGAGAILRHENIRELRRNSVVVFLRREADILSSEPVSKEEETPAERLRRKRLPLYLAASDIIVDVCETPRLTVRAVARKIYKG
ncbi:MAG: hypothetical protein E7660_07280 [Ruminococcaceae bacterium]|nr:hypothetical protein [Oscillospiraceae bacterium]